MFDDLFSLSISWKEFLISSCLVWFSISSGAYNVFIYIEFLDLLELAISPKLHWEPFVRSASLLMLRSAVISIAFLGSAIRYSLCFWLSLVPSVLFYGVLLVILFGSIYMESLFRFLAESLQLEYVKGDYDSEATTFKCLSFDFLSVFVKFCSLSFFGLWWVPGTSYRYLIVNRPYDPLLPC